MNPQTSITNRRFSARALRHAMVAAGTALVAAAAAMAQAQSMPEPAAPVAAGAATIRGMALGPTLTIHEVYDRMVHIGYRDLREIDWDDGLYKVEATSADGRFVKLYVDGRSGTLMGVRTRR